MNYEQVTRHQRIGRARDARPVVRSSQPDPVQPGRWREARLRADQGHRVLRRGQARTRNSLRGTEPARSARPDRGARKPGPAPPLPADRGRCHRAQQLPQGPAAGRRGRAEPPSEHLGDDMTADAGVRASRLLLWYPPAWRARYGDEFAELLAAEFA